MTKDIFLITGGSGFIGSYLANYLIYLNLGKVYIIDKDLPPPYASPSIKFKRLNILDFNKLSLFIKQIKPTFIYHLAARTDLEGNHINDYISNTTGTENIIKSSNQCKSIKRIIFSSSMLVCKVGYYPVNNDDFCPPNLYGKSKVIGEKIIKNNTHHYKWCIVRPTSIWGPGFKHPYRQFFNYILQKNYFHIGDKNVFKTYGYIGNIAHQLVKLIKVESSQINKKTFYLGDSSKYCIREWSNEISKFSSSGKIIVLPYFLAYLFSIFGDLLKKFKIKFPLTTFRLKNMTSDNIININPILKITGKVPFSRRKATKLTLDWLKNEKKLYQNYNGFQKLFNN